MKGSGTVLSALLAGTMVLAQLSSRVELWAQSQVGPSPQPREYPDVPIQIESIEPIPLKGDDNWTFLSYQLYLTNWAYSELTLKRVEILDGRTAAALARYDEKELSDFYRFRLLPPQQARLRQIPSGRRAVLFVWISFDKPEEVPSPLRHRLIFEANPLIKLLREQASQPGSGVVLDGITVSTRSDTPIRRRCLLSRMGSCFT